MKVISLRTKRPVLRASMDVVDNADGKIERVEGGFTIEVDDFADVADVRVVFVPDSNVIEALCEKAEDSVDFRFIMRDRFKELKTPVGGTTGSGLLAESEPQPAKKPDRRKK